MKARYFLILLLAMGCSREKEQSNITTLNVDEFEKSIANSSNEIILDVRTSEEFAEGHLVNATLINFHDADFKQKVTDLKKDQPIFVYCASGVRSDKAARILVDQGFTDVYVMADGIKEWVNLEKPLVR
jgi:rhodanese-related sulfurtransferase